MRILEFIVMIAVAGGLGWLGLKKSREPAALLFKWIITAVLVGFLGWYIHSGIDSEGMDRAIHAFLSIVLGCFVAVILSTLWVPTVGSWAAGFFTNEIDGGNVEADPEPRYALIETRRHQGKYREAIQRIHEEFQTFPNDFRLHLMLAEIQVENLGELEVAMITLRRQVERKDQEPKNVVYLLNLMTDWQLKYARDSETARQLLEEIQTRFPETEHANRAAERIAHLASAEHLLEPEERKPMRVIHRERLLGLEGTRPEDRPAEESAEEIAARMEVHLAEHPLDMTVREKFAVLLATQLNQLARAEQEIEFLLGLEQPARRKIQWLHLLADLRITMGADVPGAHASLQRIIEEHPDSAAAEAALRRQTLLKLELTNKEQLRKVKLQEYEKDLGLDWVEEVARKARERMEEKAREEKRELDAASNRPPAGSEPPRRERIKLSDGTP